MSSSSASSAGGIVDLDDLIKSLSAQITETGWIEAEIARKRESGEQLVNVFELAAAVKAEEEAEALRLTTTETGVVLSGAPESTVVVVHSVAPAENGESPATETGVTSTSS